MDQLEKHKAAASPCHPLHQTLLWKYYLCKKKEYLIHLQGNKKDTRSKYILKSLRYYDGSIEEIYYSRPLHQILLYPAAVEKYHTCKEQIQFSILKKCKKRRLPNICHHFNQTFKYQQRIGWQVSVHII